MSVKSCLIVCVVSNLSFQKVISYRGQVLRRKPMWIIPSQCLQRLGSGGASSSPSSRCRTGMAAHPAPAPPPPVRQLGAGTLHLDRSCSGGGVAAATEPEHAPPAPAGRRRPFPELFWATVTHGSNGQRRPRNAASVHR